MSDTTNDQVDPLDTAPFGALIWHSSGPDEGPDVGVSIKLGDNKLLWCGEITNRLYAETEGAAELGSDGGWWIILYDGPTVTTIGKCCDHYVAREAFERLSALLHDPDIETGCADDQTFAGFDAGAVRNAAEAVMGNDNDSSG